jgi:quercetin dioxygenase-like cupin family protein
LAIPFLPAHISGKPAAILKPGEASTTTAGEVHNVKNASSSAPARALLFWLEKKDTKLDDLSVPAKLHRCAFLAGKQFER